MTRPQTLDYQPHEGPTLYEWEMESERARWLRRRFLWFSGMLAVLAVLTLPFAIAQMFSRSGYLQWHGGIGLAASVLQAGAAGWAWWYAWRAVRNQRRLFAIAFWLVVSMGVLGIVGARVGGELVVRDQITRAQPRQVQATPADPRRDAAQQDDGSAATVGATPAVTVNVQRAPQRAAVNPARVQALQRRVSLVTIAQSVFLTHLIACLFLPWTVREATRPALVLLAAAGFIVLADLVIGRGTFGYLASATAILPLTVLPGIAWCWWRNSRFRKHYRFTFESQQYRQLRHELDGARRIHEANLPAPRNWGGVRLNYAYEPMRQIGGDMLFVHPPTHTTTANPTNPATTDAHAPPTTLVLLDVTGHGIAAALTVNRLTGELERIFAENPGATCTEVLEALNRYVYLTLSNHGIFVTGVVFSTGPEAGPDEPVEVCFASAGHPAAFLRRTDGRIEELHSSSMMLGVLPPEAFEADEHAFQLEPGEALLAYTDGAMEARNWDDHMLGITGLREMAGRVAAEVADPFRWPDQLIRRVSAFRSAPPADDTLVAVLYRPESAVPAEVLTVGPSA